MDQLPRLGKRELICLLLFTCIYVVSVWRGFLFLWVLGLRYVILLWHSLSLPYDYLFKTFQYVLFIVSECENSRYGVNCSSSCGHCLGGGEQCHNVNGTCLSGCVPGWQDGLCVDSK